MKPYEYEANKSLMGKLSKKTLDGAVAMSNANGGSLPPQIIPDYIQKNINSKRYER